MGNVSADIRIEASVTCIADASLLVSQGAKAQQKREKAGGKAGAPGAGSQLKTNQVRRSDSLFVAKDWTDGISRFSLPLQPLTVCANHPMQDLLQHLPKDGQEARVSRDTLTMSSESGPLTCSSLSRCRFSFFLQAHPTRRVQAQQDIRCLLPWSCALNGNATF